jgi:hypothetical protein
VALENTDTIDILTNLRSIGGHGVELYIVDGGTVGEDERRYQLLTAKLATYVQYVMSYEFFQEYPGLTPGDVTIRVVCAIPPTEAMAEITAVCAQSDLAHPITVTFESTEEFRRRLTAGGSA